MPVGYSSPSRNFFLLGAVGGDVVTNFFKGVDRSLDTFNSFRLKQLNYAGSVGAEQNYIIGGNKYDGTSYLAADTHGWFEKRTFNSDTLATATAYEVTVSSTIDDNVEINDIKLDSSGNTYIAGRADDSCFVGKYDSSGNVVWNSTSFTGDAIFYGLALDSSSNLYACGQTENADEDAIVQRFDNDGNVSWGKTISTTNGIVKLQRCAINSKGHLVAVGYIEDATHEGDFQTKFKGYIIKLDIASGDILWTRTLEDRYYYSSIGLPESVICEDITIDNDDDMYVVGRMLWDGAKYHSFLVKYTAEGNIAWQTQTPRDNTHRVQHFAVKTDSDTKQTVVFGDYYNTSTADASALISKYDQAGNLLWRRKVTSSEQGSSWIYDTRLDADSTFYYMAFTDDNTNVTTGDPDRYVFGKVSTSGNGLGSFQYNDGTGRTIDYTILTVGDTLAKLWDGSVRQDTTDFITYPYSANKLLFDDLATKISNKKAQIAEAGTYQESGSPAIRPADFSDVNVIAGETTIPAQNRQNMIGKTYNMVPEDYGNVNDYTRRWRGQSANVVVDFGFEGPYEAETFSTSAIRYALAAATGRRLEYAGPVLVQDQEYTFSMWFKRIASDAVWNFQAYNISALGSSGTYSPIIREIDFYGNTIKTISSGINQYNPQDDEWHRISWTFKSDSNSTVAIGGYDGSGGTGNRWYLYGAQFVDGTLPLPFHSINDLANGGIDPRIDTLKDTTPPVTSGYFDFTGNDSAQDMIELPSVDYRDAIWSAEAWIYIPSTWTSGSQYPNIISQGASAGWDTPGWSIFCFRNYGVGTGYTIGTGMRNRFGTLGVNDVIIETLTAPDQPTDTWIHAVATCDGTTRRLYINGTEVSNGSQTISYLEPPLINGKPLETVKIGGAYSVSSGFRTFFPGRIGEARSYGRALTPAQVFQNYNATKSKYINEAPDIAPKISDRGIVYDSNLLLNYDFGNPATYDTRFAGTYGNPTTVKNLSSTSYTGTINGLTFNSAGYFEFNNVLITMSDWIEIPSFTGFTGGNSNFSICFWVRTDFTSNSSNPESVVFYGNEAAGEAVGVSIESNGRIAVNHETPTRSWTTNSSPITANTWHHVCLTYDTTSNVGINASTVYVDGSYVEYDPLPGTINLPTSSTLYMGRKITSGSDFGRQDFNGDIGELQIYNRALSIPEVSQNFIATVSKYR